MDHVVGRGQVQPHPARLERDQEAVALPCLERRDALGPRPGRRLPVEGLEGDARAGLVLLDQLPLR